MGTGIVSVTTVSVITISLDTRIAGITTVVGLNTRIVSVRVSLHTRVVSVTTVMID